MRPPALRAPRSVIIRTATATLSLSASAWNVGARPHNDVMPGIPHEAVVEVLRTEPQLLAMLLGQLGLRLPSGAIPVIADSNLSSRDPHFMKTLLADNVFVFPGLRKKGGV